MVEEQGGRRLGFHWRAGCEGGGGDPAALCFGVRDLLRVSASIPLMLLVLGPAHLKADMERGSGVGLLVRLEG